MIWDPSDVSIPTERDIAVDLNIYEEKDQKILLYMMSNIIRYTPTSDSHIIVDILRPIAPDLMYSEELDYFVINLAKTMMQSTPQAKEPNIEDKTLKAIQNLSSKERYECRQTIYQLTI